MKYIADFNRSRPLFECVDQPVFTAALPDWEAPSTKFGRQYRKWHRQVELWKGRLQSEASLQNHPLCHSQAMEVAAAVTDLTQLLEFLHLRGPNPEAQVRIAWHLHGMGRSQVALPMLLALAEEIAAVHGEDAVSFADFLWMAAEMQMALKDWPAAYRNAESAKYVYISNLGEGSEGDQKCHWTMAHSRLLSEQYAQAERLALGFSDGTVPHHPINSIYPARALQLLAVVKATQRDFAGALALLHRAQEATGHLERPPEDFQPRLEVFQGILCRKLGMWNEAERLLLGGKAQLAALLSAKHLDVGRASLETARLYVLQEEHEAAGRLFKEALEIFQPLKQARQEQAIAAFFRARLFRIQGKKGKARNATKVGRKACAELGNPLSEWALRLRLEVIHLQLAAAEFDDALHEIQALLTEGGFALRTPQLGELKLLQGRTWLALGNLQAARQVLQEVADFPEEPEDLPLAAHACQDLAETWMAEKDFARACRCLSASIMEMQKSSPDQALLRGRHEFLHGCMALMEGSYRTAVAHFERGVAELNSGDHRHEYLQAECRLGKAEALIAQNDWGTAIEHLKRYADSKELRGFQTERHRARVQYLFGMALFLAGNTRKSHGYVKKAVSRLESNAEARRNPELYLNACIQLAIGCKDRKSYSEAIEALTAMLGHLEGHLHPYPKELSTIHLLLGEAYADTSQVEQAVRHFRQCLALRTKHIGPAKAATLQVHSLLAELYQAHAMPEEALSELMQKSAKSDFPWGCKADQELKIDIAQQQCHLGWFQDALTTLALLPPMDSEKNIDPLTAGWLTGQCHLGAGDPEQAMQAWNRVKELQPPPAGERLRTQIRQRLAELYLDKGDLTSAHLHYAVAFELLDKEGNRKDAFHSLIKATRLLQDLGRSQEYAQSLARAQRYASTHKNHVSSAKAIQVCSAQAELHLERGHPADALALFQTAIAWGQTKLHQKHLPLLAHCQLQAARLEDPEKAAERLAWIEKEYKRQKADLDLVLARSCMALANLFWDSGRVTAALGKAAKAVRTYSALDMSESVECIEARHSLALLQSDAVQEADAEEILVALRNNAVATLSRTFTIQNLEDHLQLLQAQRQAQQGG